MPTFHWCPMTLIYSSLRLEFEWHSLWHVRACSHIWGSRLSFWGRSSCSLLVGQMCELASSIVLVCLYGGQKWTEKDRDARHKDMFTVIHISSDNKLHMAMTRKTKTKDIFVEWKRWLIVWALVQLLCYHHIVDGWCTMCTDRQITLSLHVAVSACKTCFRRLPQCGELHWRTKLIK